MTECSCLKTQRVKLMKNLDKTQKNILFAVTGVLVIAIVVIAILLFPDRSAVNNSESSISKNETQTDSNVESESASSTETESGTEIVMGTEDETESETESESEPAPEPPVEDVPVYTTEFDVLSNASEGWGPGGDLNELNQWSSCFSYNDKYGKYGAYFMVENSNYIYLTMDEGYENGYTPAILDTLKEKNVKVVFFVTAQFVRENPELVQRMIDEGHTVGNHSTSHPSKGMPSLSIEDQKNDIMGLHNTVLDKFGYEMKLFRNPAGIFSEQSLAVTNSLGYKSVFWSFAYLDYDTANQPEPTAALNKMVSRLHPGAIYLLHAVSATNTEVLGDFIDQARAAGYEFAVFK